MSRKTNADQYADYATRLRAAASLMRTKRFGAEFAPALEDAAKMLDEAAAVVKVMDGVRVFNDGALFASAFEPIHEVHKCLDTSISCPHCRKDVRLPLTVRTSDLEAFGTLFTSSCDAMMDLGVTEKVISQIRARCHAAIAIRKMKGERNA